MFTVLPYSRGVNIGMTDRVLTTWKRETLPQLGLNLEEEGTDTVLIVKGPG